MRHRQNPDRTVPDEIRDVISENLQVDPPVSLWPEPWNFGIIADPLNDCANIFLQPNTQSWFGFLVVSDGFG
jgi:hypothetical protein